MCISSSELHTLYATFAEAPVTQDRDYVHLSYPPTSGWVIRLVNVLLNSQPEVQERRVAWWKREEVDELALALASKLEVLRIVTRRLDERLRNVGKELLDRPDEVLACLKENAAFHVRGDDLLWETLVDLDGFFFEARSAYEILEKLLCKCFVFIFQREIRKEDVRETVREQGVGTDWIDVLRRLRNLFIHDSAPWLAVRILSRDPLRLDWIVLKKNVETLDSPEDYIDFERCREIYGGLNATLQAIAYWVEREIEKLETS